MTPDTRARIEQALNAKIVGSRAVAGGDINEATRIELSDGRLAFVKTNLDAPRGMFPAEAVGLDWLAQADALRTPKVYAVCRPDATGQAAYLVLEWMAPGPPGKQFDERLGRSLARLHQTGAPSFGFDSDNFIGSLPQINRPKPNWSEFYYCRRLEPQVSRAVDARRLDAVTPRAFEKLAARLGDIFAVPEPPARLHGDLWGGNLYVDEAGDPCLIDPAVYGGHREMDLGMMRLFGGFSASVFESYNEAYPLAPGYLERMPLTQLYPLLVHVNLFGGGYSASVQKIVNSFV